ncbi:hypothetical protein [Streptomyces solicathayae]|uniref:HTTM domain-containing protein n=1 Tax=Streptomyces solicathayae TaxID=3081768 RepID=A0ABZ0M4W8_9ACTN|nr:hypothetical protein [Streptomyces sp. HUAS YS2]WOX26481.1 hypothetical protein R2D22_35945 [Streptomyces sp. HUAS YS2]
MNLDPAHALDLTARLAAAAALLSNCEALAASGRMFAYPGVFHISGVQSMHWRRSPLLAVLGGRETQLLVLGLLGSLTGVLLGPWNPLGYLALLTALAVRLAMGQRRILGSDGAEQLTTLVLLSVALAGFPPFSAARTALAVGFIAAQLVLCYTTSGVSKLASPVWRGGAAVGDIIGTQTYGLHLAARALGRVPFGSPGLGWAVMLFEAAFAAALFGPPWVVLSALGAALLFHLGCAVVMGLNDFLWAFPATYPCVLVSSQWLR